jgi:hypothetical protein
MPRAFEITCGQCGKAAVKTQPAKYCSAACRVAAHDARIEAARYAEIEDAARDFLRRIGELRRGRRRSASRAF